VNQLDTVTTLDVDLDAVVPCHAPGCPNPPAWLWSNLCTARHSFAICDGHKVKSAELVAQYIRKSTYWCMVCDQPIPAPCYEVRPL
jgi:hypothetical protein